MQIELQPQEVDYLLQILAQRPLGEALPVFESIRGQVQAAAQQQPQHGQVPEVGGASKAGHA